jgi:gamma-glutamyl-gamma-aminobutyrate hydrolase PuuD
MTPPRIGIPTVAADPPATYPRYATAVQAAGGVCVWLRPGEVAAACDGVLLLGGGDIAAERYGASAHPQNSAADPVRDALELTCLATALTGDAPVLAICRGMQVMNVLRGGSLIQHLPDIVGEHRIADGGQHPVTIASGSHLAGLLGSGPVSVNSRHHQAIDRLGDGLVATAHAADGVVEAVELPGRRFCLGVQWHPEDLAAGRPDQAALFTAFITACRG